MANFRALVTLMVVVTLIWFGWSIGILKIPFTQEITERQQLREDEIECGVYIVLADMKAAGSRSQAAEEKIVKTFLNHHEKYKIRICDILYRMTNLVVPNTARKVPNRQAWYLKLEFAVEAERKRALRVSIRELWEKRDTAWKATHYIRPDRPRTLGNQTEAEKKALRDQFVSFGVEDGFEFFGS